MQTLLNRWTGQIKKWLADRYDLEHLKKMAFGIALSSCLVSGSIMLFPLFASALHNVVGLSYTSINVIVSLSAVGMYLCLPVLGYLADCYGPALLSLISIWAFCPAYFVNAVLVKSVTGSRDSFAELNGIGVSILAVSFGFIGLATSSLYFSSLLTCAKIYPDHKSMAISLPVTCYGLSSLMGAQMMKLKYFQGLEGGELHLGRVFMFFAGLYFVMGLLNFVSNSIVSIEQEVIFEAEPLLPESTNELRPRSSVEPVDHKARYFAFLKDKSAWILLVSLLLNIGPLESFQNNLASIIRAAASESVLLSDQVSVLALSSTSIRLVIGVISDFLSSPKRKYPICKVWLLVALIAVGVAAQLAVINHVSFSLVSVLSGICYGGLFTIYPTIIASVWGVDLMGSTWGSFMVAPAIGSISFSLLHGEQMDGCKQSKSGSCLHTYFTVTGLSLFLSLVCVLVVYRIWYKRGLRCF